MRRRLCCAVLAGCGLAGAAAGQSPSTYNVVPTPGMPGLTVGTAMVAPAGIPIAKAAPQAGARVGTGPAGIPSQLDPRTPAGQAIDLTNVIAPYPNQPKAAPSFWDSLQARWATVLGSGTPVVKSVGWTPGLARRNRERAQEKMAWQRN